jgi:putative pyruvate formate lyase activating enzyme
MSLPSYLDLFRSGELQERAEKAEQILSSCTICPRQCGVNRNVGGLGFCRTGQLPMISSFGPHFGEEPPLVGRNGSGTIFFTHCNLRCGYCQNYEISQLGCGREVSMEELAGIMLKLQETGCHNINLVSPTHVVPQIIAATEIAASRGLAIPLVYNTGTYDTAGTLALLNGIVDIYMPDTKYGRDEVGLALSGVPDYSGIMKDALREMHRQVGDLVCQEGIAVRGLIIRHLVLPDDLANSEHVMAFIAREISRESYVNIMAQYRPTWQVLEEPEHPLYRRMQRTITTAEYLWAVQCAKKEGLHRGFDGAENC